MTEKSMKPVPKVQAGINWGAFATVFLGAVAIFFPDVHTRVPPGFEVPLGALLGSIASSAAGWCKADVRPSS